MTTLATSLRRVPCRFVDKFLRAIRNLQVPSLRLLLLLVKVGLVPVEKSSLLEISNAM